jgi:hypothetical protein
MSVTRIVKRSLPDHSGEDIEVINDWCHIGTLTFDSKGNSTWTDAPGQQPHRRWPLKRKYRNR